MFINESIFLDHNNGYSRFIIQGYSGGIFLWICI